MRKQLDPRIGTLISNCVKQNQRSFIVLVGDRGRDQVVNLHYLLSQARVSARPSVLWCYKKELGFTTFVSQTLLSYVFEANRIVIAIEKSGRQR
jgi:N-acetyltransferase 10